jgi:hypothetical protein
MRRAVCRILVSCAAAALALPAMGQPSADSVSVSHEADPVAQQPYTEEFKVESVSQLADGTTHSYKTTYLQAVDSHHRRMGLSFHYPDSPNGIPTIRASISDPENGARTEWHTSDEKAIVGTWPSAERRFGCWQTDEGWPRVSFGFKTPIDPNLLSGDERSAEAMNEDAVMAAERTGPVRDDLGIATIKGVEAHGERWTWPPSTDETANENRPYVTSETWTAIVPSLIVRQVVEYPFKPGWTKRYSMELVKLTIGEPSAKTFEPPEGFEIVTEEMHEVPCGRVTWPVP